MQDKNDIPFAHWSLKVGRRRSPAETPPAFWGEIVTAVDDLDQAISNLILTPLGSVPTEPEKGCDLLPYIDRPMPEAIANVTRAIWDAISIWEPRIVLQDVQVYEVEFARLVAEIYWRPQGSVLDDLRTTRVPLAGATSERQVA